METNPLLTELDQLSPGAKAALAGAHASGTSQAAANPMGTAPPQLAGLRQPQPNAPEPTGTIPPLNAGPKMPAIGANMPAVSSTTGQKTGDWAQRGTTLGDKEERSRLLESGAGVDQISDRIKGSSFGQNHPKVASILGPLAQGVGKVGSFAVQAATPFGPLIPGTEEHHSMLVGQANRQVGQDEAEQEKEAQTREADARASSLSNPPDRFSTLPTDQGYMSFDPKTGKAQPITGSSGETLNPVEKQQPIQHAVLPDGSVVAITRDPKTGAVTADEVFKGDGKSSPKITSLEIGGQQHSVLVDEKTGSVIKDLGPTGFKPSVVNVGAQNEHTFEYSDKALGAIAKPIEDLNMRMGRLRDTLAQGSPQADALVAPELLTVMAGGQGSGLRMNEAEIARVVGGRSQWDSLKASMQKWSLDPSAARSITADQDRQIRALISAVDGKMQRKLAIINDAREKLVGISDAGEQHRLVAQTHKSLQDVDTGGEQGGGGPSGASHEVWKDGNLIGHVVDNKYVPLVTNAH